MAMEWLKADFHMHSGEDHFDVLYYTAYDLLDRCAELGYKIVAITNHIDFTFEEAWRAYAADKGMLIMPGVEASIRGKHVVILNADHEASKLRSFSDLEAYKATHDVFIFAPHPFSWSPICLRNHLFHHADLFDGVEIHHFYTRIFNPNKRAKRFAQEYRKVLVGNSDCHHPRYLGKTYSLIEADLTIPSVMSAFRQGKVQVVTEPLGSIEAFNLHNYLRIGQLRRALNQSFPSLKLGLRTEDSSLAAGNILKTSR